MATEFEVGKVYNGKIKSIVPFGLFIEIAPGKDGLCHISEFAHERTENLNDHVKVGDMIEVKLIEIDDRNRLRLSRKAAM